jgi:hypothetical protein
MTTEELRKAIEETVLYHEVEYRIYEKVIQVLTPMVGKPITKRLATAVQREKRLDCHSRGEQTADRMHERNEKRT